MIYYQFMKSSFYFIFILYTYRLPLPKYPLCEIVWRAFSSALNNVYMLEFHPTLAIAGRIPEALKHAYWVSAARCKAYMYMYVIPTYM